MLSSRKLSFSDKTTYIRVGVSKIKISKFFYNGNERKVMNIKCTLKRLGSKTVKKVDSVVCDAFITCLIEMFTSLRLQSIELVFDITNYDEILLIGLCNISGVIYRGISDLRGPFRLVQYMTEESDDNYWCIECYVINEKEIAENDRSFQSQEREFFMIKKDEIVNIFLRVALITTDEDHPDWCIYIDVDDRKSMNCQLRNIFRVKINE
jgi:hypothetical protein